MSGGITQLCNGLVPYMWDRLPLDSVHEPKDPSLREDWFVADAITAGSPFVWRGKSAEQSHRLLYRYARNRNVEGLLSTGRYQRDPEILLLHQMVGLVPALIGAASLIYIEQAQVAA